MPPDLEPASALASKPESAARFVVRIKQKLALNLSDNETDALHEALELRDASVREPLERQVRELTARANELPGLTATLDELRFVVALVRECLAEHDAANGTLGYGVQPDNAITARIRGALGALDGKLEDYPDDLAKRAARIASSEAQLASAREEALREVLRDLQQFADSFLAEARKAELSGRYDQFSEHARSRVLVQTCAQRVRKLLPPPAAQKEPHGR